MCTGIWQLPTDNWNDKARTAPAAPPGLKASESLPCVCFRLRRRIAETRESSRQPLGASRAVQGAFASCKTRDAVRGPTTTYASRMGWPTIGWPGMESHPLPPGWTRVLPGTLRPEPSRLDLSALPSPLEPSRSLAMDRTPQRADSPSGSWRYRISCCQGMRSAVLQGWHRNQLSPASTPMSCNLHRDLTVRLAPSGSGLAAGCGAAAGSRAFLPSTPCAIPPIPTCLAPCGSLLILWDRLLRRASVGSRRRILHSLDFAVSGKHYASGSSTVAFSRACNTHRDASTAICSARCE